MGNSLQEQLLKAGLVNQQAVKQTRSAKRKQAKQTGRRPDAADPATREAAARARTEKAARDRELNRQRQQAAERRAQENELRQLIHTHRVVRDGGEVAYNFSDGNKLKRIYVNASQHADLIAGRLTIVRQDTFYELVPREVAERIRVRNAALILVCNDREQTADADDPYAEYQVPDDLIW